MKTRINLSLERVIEGLVRSGVLNEDESRKILQRANQEHVKMISYYRRSNPSESLRLYKKKAQSELSHTYPLGHYGGIPAISNAPIIA